MRLPPDDRAPLSAEAFRAFVRDAPFPYTGTKSAFSRGRLRPVAAHDIRSGSDDKRTYPTLLAFIARYRDQPDLFQSFAVVFEGPCELDEAAFEDQLWHCVQSLSDKDASRDRPHDGCVATDPENPHFSLGFDGEASFVVGLHPQASCPARRFPTPALVFDLHAQFERLRAEGRYETLRVSILGRDFDLAGSLNPMVARRGEMSEARRYSGRVVGGAWHCPFGRCRKAPPNASAKSRHAVPFDQLCPVGGSWQSAQVGERTR